MIGAVRTALRYGFELIERPFERLFGPALNPLVQLGALGFFFYWVVAVSGIYLFIFFDTGIERAYEFRRVSDLRPLVSCRRDAQPASLRIRPDGPDADRPSPARIRLRSLSRGAVVFLVRRTADHLAALLVGHHRLLAGVGQARPLRRDHLVGAARLPAYLRRADRAQFHHHGHAYQPVLHPDGVHAYRAAAVPLVHHVGAYPAHLAAQGEPAAPLAILMLVALFAVSLWRPALSQGPADLAKAPVEIGLDWFFLPLYPLVDIWGRGEVWAFLGVFSLIIAAMPWLPPLRRDKPAEVDLAHCNGCARCAEDCPYEAIRLVPRTDGLPFPTQAQVNVAHCVSCGICVGACPSSTPFRRSEELKTGIDLPDYRLKELRERVVEVCNGLQRPVGF